MFAADLDSEWLILIQMLGDRRVNFLRPACGIVESIEMRLHHDRLLASTYLFLLSAAP